MLSFSVVEEYRPGNNFITVCKAADTSWHIELLFVAKMKKKIIENK
jgi:hypothetical protein